MKKIATGLILLFLSIALLAGPLGVLAADELVTCGTGNPGTGGAFDYCHWADLLAMINRVINFLIFKLAIPVAVIAIIYGGVEILRNPSSSTARTVWKNRVWGVIWGLLIMMTAYLLVKLIVTSLIGSDPYGLGNLVK